ALERPVVLTGETPAVLAATSGSSRAISGRMSAGSIEAGVRLRPHGKQNAIFAGTFTGATGLEPATSGVTGRRSGRPLGPQWCVLSHWRTGCRVLGRVLGELTRRAREAASQAEFRPR